MMLAQGRMESMNPADWYQFQSLFEGDRFVFQFKEEIQKFSQSQLKPDDVLRRFSLNGDGKLDFKEFQLALLRLGIYSDSSLTNLNKCRELFGLFCTGARKLDIDMFCRILSHWTLQLMRLQDNTSTKFSTPSMPLTENHDGELILKRLEEKILRYMDKLNQNFYKMDINSSGTVSKDEFELALSHVGIFLTPQEYTKLYESLPKNDVFIEDKQTIRYSAFLMNLARNSSSSPRVSTRPLSSGTSSCSSTSKLLRGNHHHRIWDFMLFSLDKLEPIWLQYEKIGQSALSPETFRETLLRVGITLSGPDFAALRVRLLPFSDTNGFIILKKLLSALGSTRTGTSTTGQSNSFYFTNMKASPVKTGRRVVFPSVDHGTNKAINDPNLPAPAGKSNEQRNAEANRTQLKKPDTASMPYQHQHYHTGVKSGGAPWNMSTTNSSETDSLLLSDNSDMDTTQIDAENENGITNKPLACLEKRIHQKLIQLKEIGKFTSPKTLFPGDRFGRITRGQFRQALVHLGVLARYAEVEKLFWELDPNGRGFMLNHDFYEHLQKFATTTSTSNTNTTNTPTARTITVDTSVQPHHHHHHHQQQQQQQHQNHPPKTSRAAQKVMENMLFKCKDIVNLCSQIESENSQNSQISQTLQKSKSISRQNLMWIVQEVGILASKEDIEDAMEALFGPDDKSIEYLKLEEKLFHLTSDLLSPKRRHHLSTASVVLDQQVQLDPIVQQGDHVLEHSHSHSHASSSSTNMAQALSQMNLNTRAAALQPMTFQTGGVLPNCPRRRNHQDHLKSCVEIKDYPPDGDMTTSTSTNESSVQRRQHIHQLSIIAIINDLLERRQKLKTAFGLHRKIDHQGQVDRSELVEILTSSRVNLDMSTASLREFVDVILPVELERLNYLEFLQSLIQAHQELSMETSNSSNSNGTTTTSLAITPIKTHSHSHIFGGSFSHTQQHQHYSAHSNNGNNNNSSEEKEQEKSLRSKVMGESRLKDLLESETGRRSAAILIRHAYKGVSRETSVPIENGNFETTCRSKDIRYVCYRLGLDLEQGELQYLTQKADPEGTGFISSPHLLQFFIDLTVTQQE